MKIVVNTPDSLWEFITGRNGGSDTLKYKPDDVMTSKIAGLLKCPPKDYINKKQSGRFIKIELSGFRIGNSLYQSVHRSYLSTRDQKIIVREWNAMFKDIFHNYVLAYCKGMNFRVPCQKLAIEDFCDTYNLKMDFLLYDSLKKSWDRSDQKKIHQDKFKKMKKNC